MLAIVKKELLSVRENVVFSLITIVTPLIFLLAFTFMLSGGITFPLRAFPDVGSSAFLGAVEAFEAPDGTPYVELTPAARSSATDAGSSDMIVVDEEPTSIDGVLEGRILHYINDTNLNTTKNSRNRIDGALVSFINQVRDRGNLAIEEVTTHERDVDWATGFGVSTFVFGIVVTGLFFGSLSATSEFDNQTTKLLKLSPRPAVVLVAGKLAAAVMKSIVSGLLFLLAFLALSSAIPVHWGHFTALALTLYIGFAALGLLIGLFIRSTLTSLVVSMATALTLWIAGGGFGPLSFFGDVARFVAAINPVTYAVDNARWSYFGGPAAVWWNTLVLVVFAVAAVAVCVLAFARWARDEEGGRA